MTSPGLPDISKMMRSVVVFIFFYIALCFFYTTKADQAQLQQNMDFSFPINLFYQQDYYRSVTEILRLRFHYPHESAKNRLDLFLVKNYYQLGAFNKAEMEAKRILLPPGIEKNKQKRQEAGKFLAFSLLKQGKDQLARQAWIAYVDEDKQYLPPIATEFSDRVDPLRANSFSSVIPGSGLLLSREYGKSVVSFLINMVFIAGSYQFFMNGQYGVSGLLLFFEIGWYSGGKKAAIESANLYNEQNAKEIRQRWIDGYK